MYGSHQRMTISGLVEFIHECFQFIQEAVMGEG